MADRPSVIAKHKVGSVSYVRYTQRGETFVSVEGYGVEDKDKTWKVKVDKKTGRRFYVSLGKHGRGWVLPGDDPPQEDYGHSIQSQSQSHQHSQSQSQSQSQSHQSHGHSHSQGYGKVQGHESQLNASNLSTASSVSSAGTEGMPLMDLYKQRLPFNPADNTQDVPKELVALISHEVLASMHELQLTAEGIMSVILSAVHYLNIHYAQQNVSRDEVSSIVLKLCYAVASECKANVLSSPFLECQTKIVYLGSINDSIERTVAEHTGEIDAIKHNLALREQERKKAAAKLETWVERCHTADHEVTDATNETFNIAHTVEGYLQCTSDVAKVISVTFPSEGKACLAQIELLKAQLQESSNSSRVLQESYRKIQDDRKNVQSTLSADRTFRDEHTHRELEVLREAHTTQTSENTDLKIRLKAAEMRNRDAPAQQEVDMLRQKVMESQQEIASLKRANQELEAVHQKAMGASYSEREDQTAEDVLRRMDGEDDVVLTRRDRKMLLHCVHQQKQLLETLMESKEEKEEVVDTEMFSKCLSAAQAKIRQQRNQIKELKTLLNLCLDVRDSPDDPIRTFLNTTTSSPSGDGKETLTPVMLDISPRH